jgi:peptidoglycan L-alanyl-D-glutamate endopeptidase CwlK
MITDDTLFLQRFLQSMGFYHDRLDGLYGPNTNAAFSEFQHLSERIADRTGRFDQRSETNIFSLHPQAQVKAREFLAAMKASGLPGAVIIRIISGTRTYAEQAELYAQGRTKPGPIVTNAGPGRSNHNFGIAFDVGLFKGADYLEDSPQYAAVAKVAKTHGLEWGGDWKKFPDEPHYQLPGLDLGGIRVALESGKPYVDMPKIA